MFSYSNGLGHPPPEMRVVRDLRIPSQRQVLARPLSCRRSNGQTREAAMLETKRPYNILITDDDTGCRESLRDIVEKEGYDTRLASSGEEALEIVQESPVH